MLARPSFLALMVAPSARSNIARAIERADSALWPGSRILDQVGVLGEPAGVEKEGDCVALADRANLGEVRQADRLTATAVVRHGDHAHRHPRGADPLDQGRESIDVDVSLERMPGLRLCPLVDHQINGLGSRVFDIGPGGVEVVVAGDDLAGAAHQLEEDALAGASLMRRQDKGHSRHLAQGLLEAVPASRAGVGLVAPDHPGPLLAAHGRRAAIGQQVDDHIFGSDPEEVEIRAPENRVTLGRRGHANRLDHLDLERLDDRLHAT